MTFDTFLFALRPRDTTKNHGLKWSTQSWTCSKSWL